MAGDFDRERHIFDLDVTFDELGSKFLALRKIQWVKKGEEPDESKAKLELRKWIVDKEGAEIASKGFAFLTEEGPHELTRVMVKEGFGRTKDILLELKNRDDFIDAAKHLNESEDSTDGEYFDIRSLIEEDPLDQLMNLPDGEYDGIEIKHF